MTGPARGRARGAGGTAWRALVLVAVAAARLGAQDSQYGVRGLGTPGRWESVRARSTGGAFGPFDPASPLMEASLADVGSLAAGAMVGAAYRSVDLAGTTSALRATRFPLFTLAGRVLSRLAVAAGFTTYLDKSWDVTLRDSLLLRGVQQRYTDEITSDGSVADLRFAAASRLSRRLAIGGAVHLLTGSTRMTAERRFDDSTFQAFQQAATVRYDGMGISGSVLVGLAPGLSVAAWGRSDRRLRAVVADTTVAETDLPRMAGGGVQLLPSRKARLAAAVAWRSWSRAGPGAFDTWSWSAGGEFGGGASALRFGVRGGQVPFGPGTSPPTEFAVAAGVGRALSHGRALIDLGVERLARTGGGLRERVWSVLVGVAVRP